MMKGSNEDIGFTFVALKNGDIIIHHKGRKASTLRSDKAEVFKEDMKYLSFQEQQQLMARITGNYKHGNERAAKTHPRNR